MKVGIYLDYEEISRIVDEAIERGEVKGISDTTKKENIEEENDNEIY